MKIVKIDYKEKPVDRILKVLMYSEKYQLFLTDAVYIMSVIVVLVMFYFGLRSGNWFLIILFGAFTFLAARNLYKHIKVRKAGLYKGETYMTQLKKLFGW